MNNYTIELPDGFVIDTEKSTDTKIVIKAVEEQKTECKTYAEIQRYNISERKEQFYVDADGRINSWRLKEGTHLRTTLAHVPTREIAEKIIALYQLYIIAEYYNDGWVPDWDDMSQYKHFFTFSKHENTHGCVGTWHFMQGTPCFKSREILEEAYKHNEEIFKKALSV